MAQFIQIISHYKKKKHKQELHVGSLLAHQYNTIKWLFAGGAGNGQLLVVLETLSHLVHLSVHLHVQLFVLIYGNDYLVVWNKIYSKVQSNELNLLI